MRQKRAKDSRTLAEQISRPIASAADITSMIRRLLAASAFLLVARPARAEQPHDTVTLTYLPSRAAIALCPEADYLENEVFVRLHYALFQPTAPKHLTVKIDRTSGGFRAVGEMRDDDGNILFAGTYPGMDCTFAVFSVAVALSVHYAELPEPPAPSPPEPALPSVAEPDPEPEPAEPAPPTPVVPAPGPERRRFQGGVSSVFSIGNAPSVLGGVGLFVGVRWPNVSLALEGRALFAPSVTLAQVAEHASYSLAFTAISGIGCYHSAWAFACARAEVGNLSFDNPSDGLSFTRSHITVLGLGFRFGGDRTLTSWLALHAYFEVSFQPLSGTFNEIPGNHKVWSQTGLAGSLGLGPTLTF